MPSPSAAVSLITTLALTGPREGLKALALGGARGPLLIDELGEQVREEPREPPPGRVRPRREWRDLQTVPPGRAGRARAVADDDYVVAERVRPVDRRRELRPSERRRRAHRDPERAVEDRPPSNAPCRRSRRAPKTASPSPPIEKPYLQ